MLHRDTYTMAQEQKGKDRQLGLCLLCGLPAAGKTTMAQALSQALRKHKRWQCVLLSYDELIPLESFGQQEESLEPEAQQHLMSRWRLLRHELLLYLELFLQALITRCHYYSPPPNRTETTWKSFVCCLKEQELIYTRKEESASCQYLVHSSSLTPIYFILDDNFYYRSMRYEVYQLARRYTLGFCQLFLDCQVEVCIQRNSQRQQPLPEETISTMVQKIESPNPEKYAWERNSLILKCTGYSSADNFQVLRLLFTALENPVKPLEENTEAKEMDRTVCAASVLHQADQAVRRMVSQIMQNAKDYNLTSNEMKGFAAELSNLKMVFLEELRHKINEKNQCCLPNNISNMDVASLFSHQAEDVVKKYLNKQ